MISSQQQNIMLSVEQVREYADVFRELIKQDIIHVKHRKEVIKNLTEIIDAINKGESYKIFKKGSDIFELFED